MGGGAWGGVRLCRRESPAFPAEPQTERVKKSQAAMKSSWWVDGTGWGWGVVLGQGGWSWGGLSQLSGAPGFGQ